MAVHVDNVLSIPVLAVLLEYRGVYAQVPKNDVAAYRVGAHVSILDLPEINGNALS